MTNALAYVLNPLKFGGTNDALNVGTSNTLDASAFMTLMAWLNCTSLTADQRIYVRGAGGSAFFADFGGSPTNFTSFTIPRATTSAQVRVNFSNAPIVAANKPLFVAWVLDTTADAQCRLFIGDLVTAPHGGGHHQRADVHPSNEQDQHADAGNDGEHEDRFVRGGTRRNGIQAEHVGGSGHAHPRRRIGKRARDDVARECGRLLAGHGSIETREE